jgi:inositol phosphorylceramide mannosyltransferase catalytic subunit
MLQFKILDQLLLEQDGLIIHQVWFGTIPNKASARKAYESLRIYRDSWPNKNPEWHIHIWTKQQCRDLVKSCYPEHLDMYKKFHYEIQRCDAIRYFILHRYGGLYADMDYYCNKPFSDVLKNYKKDLYLVQTPNRSGCYVSNALMYSRPRQVFWKKLFFEMENCQRSYDMYVSKHIIVMYTTGPAILNRVFHRYRMRYSLGFYPFETFHPDGITSDVIKLNNRPDVIAMHIGKGSWESNDSKFLLFFYCEWKIVLFIILTLVIPLILIRRVRGNASTL